MITIEVNGRQYINFIDARVERTLDRLCGYFKFTASSTPDQQSDFPVKANDRCLIYVDGNLVMTGVVDVNSGFFNIDTHEITIQGRDKTADVVDSTLGGEIGFNNIVSIGIVALTDHILEAMNITGISSSTNVPTEQFAVGDLVDAETGMPVFEYLEKNARKRQLLTTTDVNGNIAYVQASGINDTENVLRNQVADSSNNILRGAWTNNVSELFNQYIVRSQQAMIALNFVGSTDRRAVIGPQLSIILQRSSPVPADELVSSQGGAFDPLIRSSRILNLLAESASDPGACESRSLWQRNIARTRAFQYTATVQGHSKVNGQPWELNRLHKIEDIFADLNGRFLLNSIEWDMSIRGGNTTTLGFVDSDAYTLAIKTLEEIDAEGASRLNFIAGEEMGRKLTEIS